MATANVNQQNSPVKTMLLNDQKAGMQGLDKEAINKVIYEASKGTPYFAFQEKRQQTIDRRAKAMIEELQKASADQRKESLAKMDALGASLESERDLSHSIVHIDMDAFYAAVEMLDNPELKSKPMAVGSMQMLSTSNYEARKYGVRAAMAGFIAKKLCPDLLIVPCRFQRYREISKQIRSVVQEYDPDYSPMGLDEVYLDLTQHILKVYESRKGVECGCVLQKQSCLSASEGENSNDLFGSSDPDNERRCEHCSSSISDSERDELAYEIVNEIRNRIHEVTQLTASAGIAPNTRLAKVCSDQNKPNGQYQIQSDVNEIKKFISVLPVKKVSGIGPVQGQLLNYLGINTCSDLWLKRDVIDLLFSERSARFYMRVALGIGSTEVKSEYIRKSIGTEETFKEISKPEELHQKCEDLCEEVSEDLRTRNLVGKVVVLKIKTIKYNVHTRNSTLKCYSSEKDVITKAAKKLLDGEIGMATPHPLRLRLMGIRMTNLVNESEVHDNKQVKLKEFFQVRTECPTLATSAPPPIQTFSCPVCELEFNCSSSTFNTHVDECLAGRDSVACSTLTEAVRNGKPRNISTNDEVLQDDREESKSNSENCLRYSVNKSEVHDSEVKRKSFFQSRCQAGTTTTAAQSTVEDMKYANAETQQNTEEELHENSNGITADFVQDDLLCPVCSVVRKSSELELTAHIDTCLSRAAIKELLSTENSVRNGIEKRKPSPDKQNGKKMKISHQKLKRIDDYFH